MVTKYIATPAALLQALLRAKHLETLREPVPRGTQPPPPVAPESEEPSPKSETRQASGPKSEKRTRAVPRPLLVV